MDEALDLLKMRRLEDEEALLLFSGIGRDLPKQKSHGLRKDYVSDFEVMLQQASGDLPVDLDLLALFGAMYRETCLSFRPAEAAVLGHYFHISLMQLCEQEWIKPVSNELEDIARQRVLYGMGGYLPGSSRATGIAYAINRR